MIKLTDRRYLTVDLTPISRVVVVACGLHFERMSTPTRTTGYSRLRDSVYPPQHSLLLLRTAGVHGAGKYPVAVSPLERNYHGQRRVVIISSARE